MKLAIVFDLDGTLIDSAPDVRAALNRLLAEEGRRQLSLAEVQGLVGEGARVLIEKAWLATGTAARPDDVAALVARYLDHYRAHPADETLVFPGVREELARLSQAGHRLGICTNKPHDMSLLVLDALDLGRWFDAVLGGDFPRRKPDGEHVRETLRLMRADAMPAVFVGDSLTDVRAARDAGLPSIILGHGYANAAPDQLGADHKISAFGELPALLERLFPCVSP